MNGIRTIRFMNEHSFTFFTGISVRALRGKTQDHFLTLRHSHLGGFMRSKIQLLQIIFACLLLSGMVFAQGVGASGDIRGTVTDPQGAVLSGATITATDVDKGIKHTVSSDSDGAYHFASLSPATYSVSVAKSGFQTEVAKSVVVNVGQTSTVDFPMKVSQVSEQVEVTAEAPVVETERGGQANVIDDRAIQALPMNRRDYLTF